MKNKRPRLSQFLELGSEGFLDDVHNQLLPRLVSPLGEVLDVAEFSFVVVVVRPVGEGVRSGDWHLQGQISLLLDRLELIDIVRLIVRDLLDDACLLEIPVIKAFDPAAELEAAKLAYDMLVHLNTPLLAVVDIVNASFLKHLEDVEGTPVHDLLFPVRIVSLQDFF